MNFWDKMEKKFGRYAIPNLSLYLILCFGCGYLIYAINPAMLNYLTLDPYKILHGQIWRLFTWILIPGDGGSINIYCNREFYHNGYQLSDEGCSITCRNNRDQSSQ